MTDARFLTPEERAEERRSVAALCLIVVAIIVFGFTVCAVVAWSLYAGGLAFVAGILVGWLLRRLCE